MILRSLEPESNASANSAISAYSKYDYSGLQIKSQGKWDGEITTPFLSL